MRPFVLLFFLTSLACGGFGGPDLSTLDQACVDPDPVRPDARLATLDIPPGVPKLAVEVTVSTTEITVDRIPVALDGLAGELSDKAETARELGKRAGGDFAFRGQLNLFVDADVPASTVAPVLAAAHGAGFREVRAVVFTKTPTVEPAYADPMLAVAVRTELQLLPDAAARSVHLAQRMSDAVALCPPANEAFRAVAAAPAELKCQLFARGLQEAAPMCPVVLDTAEVATLFQVSMAPWHPMATGFQTVTLDAAVEPLVLPASTPWSEVLGKLGSEPVNLVAR